MDQFRVQVLTCGLCLDECLILCRRRAIVLGKAGASRIRRIFGGASCSGRPTLGFAAVR